MYSCIFACPVITLILPCATRLPITSVTPRSSFRPLLHLPRLSNQPVSPLLCLYVCVLHKHHMGQSRQHYAPNLTNALGGVPCASRIMTGRSGFACIHPLCELLSARAKGNQGHTSFIAGYTEFTKALQTHVYTNTCNLRECADAPNTLRRFTSLTEQQSKLS